MASWQTTSYPNCNSIHEIDLVRSSGPGSYTFPNNKHQQQQQLYNNNNNYNRRYRRRSISAYPPSLQNYMFYLHATYPSNKSKRVQNAKFNARGLMKEESIEFLGQGWFRSAWEMYTESIPEYVDDDDDGNVVDEDGIVYKDWGYEESVVLKTLRLVFYVLTFSFVYMFVRFFHQPFYHSLFSLSLYISHYGIYHQSPVPHVILTPQKELKGISSRNTTNFIDVMHWPWNG